MSMHWDKRRDRRLISFLYNSNFFTAMTFNDDLSFIFNFNTVGNNRPFGYIDYRINSTSLDEMINKIDEIINNSVASTVNRYVTNPDGLLQQIVNYILTRPIYSNTQPTQSNINNNLIKELENYFYKNTLRDEDFNWISINNDRVVNFVWSSLISSHFDSSKSNIKINYDLDASYNNHNISNLRISQHATPYRAMNLEANPPDLNSKLENIKLFFDSWGEPLVSQKQLMASIKTKWDNIKNRSEIIEWLNKNEELITWSWSYIVENMLNKSVPEWVNISSSETREIKQQTKDTIITLYDLLDRETDKKLLKSQLSKNGAQQKYRIKEKLNTKVLNLNVSVETKSNLEKLKKIKNKSIREIIEDLINEELNRTTCRQK